MNATDLQSLARRVEEADGPSYTLDCEIWDAIYPGERDERFAKVNKSYGGRLGPADKDGYVHPLRPFTASLDAALTLVPEGRFWRVGHGTVDRGWAHLNIRHPNHCDRGDEHSSQAATPALALTAVCLRALSHKDQSHG